MEITICKLCHDSAELKSSHIVPASMHKILKDKNGKNINFSLPGNITLKNQRDLKEYMLCETCEGLLSRLEKHTIEILRPLWSSSREGRTHHVIPGGSTQLILQFVHSVFWRASVSTTLPKYKLPQSDEEVLRGSILNKIPIAPPQFAVRLDFFTYLRTVGSSNMMQSPGKYDAFPDASYSAFVSLGIIFSMQAPAASKVFNLGPFLAPGKDYKIMAAPPVIELPCIAALEEVRKIALQHSRKSSV